MGLRENSEVPAVKTHRGANCIEGRHASRGEASLSASRPDPPQLSGRRLALGQIPRHRPKTTCGRDEREHDVGSERGENDS